MELRSKRDLRTTSSGSEKAVSSRGATDTDTWIFAFPISVFLGDPKEKILYKIYAILCASASVCCSHCSYYLLECCIKHDPVLHARHVCTVLLCHQHSLLVIHLMTLIHP